MQEADAQQGEMTGGTEGEPAVSPDDDSNFFGMTQVEIGIKRSHTMNKAVIAAVKTIAELSRAADLQAYQRHPKIIQKFGDKF